MTFARPSRVNLSASDGESLGIDPRLIAGGAALLMLTIFTYSHLIFSDAGFIWDDDSYVVNNSALRNGAAGLRQIWFGILPDPRLYCTPQYYPMTLTTFWLEQKIWGLNPLGYHVINIILHGTSAILLWIVMRRLEVPGAWVIAAIWAVHPVQVETVAWVTERKNVLSGTFYFASLLLYLRVLMPCSGRRRGGSGARLGEGAAGDGGRYNWRLPLDYTLSLLFFLAALLSKSVTASLPAVVLLVIWWKRGKIALRDIVLLIPFFVCGIGIGEVTRWMEWNVVGAAWHMSFAEKLIVAGRAPWFYASKLVFPFGLTFIYPRWQIDLARWWQFGYVVASIGVLVALWILRKRIGRGPLVAALFFVGTLFPALGFFAVFPMRYSFVADHFQYLARIGLIALIVAVIDRRLSDAARGGVWIVVLFLLCCFSWSRCRAFHNLESLWRDTLARNPDAWMAHNNLGAVLLDQNRLPEAAEEFRRTLALKPEHADAIASLGIIAQKENDLATAEQRFLQALALAPAGSQAAANAHAHLAALYASENRPDDAIEEYQQAIAMAPHSGDWINELGMIYFTQGKVDRAIDCFDQMLKMDPNSVAANANLGYAMLQLGRMKDAIDHWTIVVRQQPDNYRVINSMGNAYLKLGMRELAINSFRRALQIKPDYEPARKNLAAVGG